MTELWMFAKSCLVGLVVIAVEVGLLAGLDALAVQPAISFAAIQLVGTAITFALGKLWAFDARHSGCTRRELGRSVVVFAGSLVGNTAVPSVLTYGLGASPVAAFLTSQVAVYVLWNYPARRHWVFATR